MNQSKPVVGQTMTTYCECANEKRDSYSTINTTWICKGKIVQTGFWPSSNITEFYWECLNCGKKRTIGKWNEAKTDSFCGG